MAVRSIDKNLFFIFSATTINITNVIAASYGGISITSEVIGRGRLKTAGSVVASLHLCLL